MQVSVSSAYCDVDGCAYYDQAVDAYVDTVDIQAFGEGFVDDAVSEQCGHTVTGWLSWTREDMEASFYDD